MSEIPPINDPNQPNYSSAPPTHFAGYTRPGSHYGSPEKLKALADGYFGLNTIFILNIALALGARALGPQLVESMGALMAWSSIAAGLFVIIAAASFPSNRQIAFGKDWPAGAGCWLRSSWESTPLFAAASSDTLSCNCLLPKRCRTMGLRGAFWRDQEASGLRNHRADEGCSSSCSSSIASAAFRLDWNPRQEMDDVESGGSEGSAQTAFSPYPRHPELPGSADQLQALLDGYTILNWIRLRQRRLGLGLPGHRRDDGWLAPWVVRAFSWICCSQRSAPS